MEKNNTTCCLVFTKTPEPGKTKTRLIPALGINGAYKVHVKLLKYTLKLTSKIKGIDFYLYYTSEKNNNWLLTLAAEHNLLTQIQTGKDLGERMYNASKISLTKYSHCIIIGTDCPELSVPYIEKAEKYLATGYDAVIGPAHDGGYVLIGLNKTNSDIFNDINWGSHSVFKSTIESFQRLNIQYKTLATLHDIDRKEDLQYLKLI